MADMQEVTEKSEKEATNKEARALYKAMPRLKLGLSSSIQTIALHCYAKEIIPSTVYEGMFEGEWKAENSRARYFINCILNKLKQHEESNAGEVERIIQQLARIVRHDSALEHIAQTIGNCKTARDVRINSPKIATGITSSLSTIAMKAAAAEIITYSECHVCIQADAGHESRCTNILLQEIFKQVNFKPDTLQVFLGILRGQGAPISHYCEPIERNLRQQ